MAGFLIPAAIATLSAVGQGFFAGKARDRERRLSEAFAESERAARERETARNLAAQTTTARFQEEQRQTGRQRIRSMFLNGMVGAQIATPSQWAEFPTAEDISAEARRLNPEAFRARTTNVPGTSTTENVLGGLALGAGTVANASLMSSLFSAPGAQRAGGVPRSTAVPDLLA